MDTDQLLKEKYITVTNENTKLLEELSELSKRKNDSQAKENLDKEDLANAQKAKKETLDNLRHECHDLENLIRTQNEEILKLRKDVLALKRKDTICNHNT